jgi:beta-galactosidase GanA
MAIVYGGDDNPEHWPEEVRAHLAGLPPAGRRPGLRDVERYKNHPAVVLWHINNDYVAPCSGVSDIG